MRNEKEKTKGFLFFGVGEKRPSSFSSLAVGPLGFVAR